MPVVAVAVALLLSAPPPDKIAIAAEQQRVGRPWCQGAYATEFTALSATATQFTTRPENQFTYCLRVSAIYECVSYAQDGSIKRARKSVFAHGTAFGYRRDKGDTLLATNQHVAEYPPVTDEEHQVEGVPHGCKRVTDSLKIVENERDDYESDDVTLTRVVADPALDLAVVRAKGTALNVMPWKFGKSSALRERNVVDVRGFPLGAFKATNLGSVISTYDRDDYKEWDHDDFVIDARLSQGNSGSPVLAVSCATGEYELVGIYHAGYTRGSSLNVVIQIDQARDLLSTLRRSTAQKPDGPQTTLSASDRKRLTEAASVTGIFFPFGSLSASVRARDGRLVFDIYPKNFPTESWPGVVIEDLPTGDPKEFGTLGRLWFGNARGLKEADRAEMSAEVHGQVERGLEILRRAALNAVEYRRAAMQSDDSKDAFERTKRLEKVLKRTASSNREALQAVADLIEREGLKAGEKPDLPAPGAEPPLDAGP